MQIKLIRSVILGIVLLLLMMTAGICSADEVNVELVGKYEVFSSSYYLDSVAILDNNAYVIINAPDVTLTDTTPIFSDLERIDVSDSGKPTIEEYISLIGFAASDVALSDTHTYVADSNGLHIAPLTGFSFDSEVTNYYTDNSASVSGVAVSGNYAYLNVGGSSLVILDTTNPSSPKYMGRYDTGGYGNDDAANGIAVERPYAYLATPGIGLVVVDVSSPSSPKLAGSCDIAGDARDVAVSDKYAYVISNHYVNEDWAIDLDIIDITNPSSPKKFSYSPIGDGYGYAYDIAVAGNYAYIADSYNGLEIVDISNPAAPTIAGSYHTVSGAKDVAVSGNNVYLAAGNSGLLILKTEIQEQIEAVQGAVFEIIKPGAIFEGPFDDYDYGTYPMRMEVTDVNGNEFSGILHWTTLRDSKTKFRGTIDSEQNKVWFTEYELIQGSNIVLNGNYYAELTGSTLSGYWNLPSGRTRGTFSISLQDDAQDQPLTEGSLVQVPGSPEVYLIENGLKRHFTSPEALEWNGYSFSNVIQISSETLASIRDGADISITQAIIDKYHTLGGSQIFGQAVSKGELDGAPDSAGNYCSYVNFQNGAIECFKKGTLAGKAYAIFNPFFTKWKELGYGSGILGYPIEDMSGQLTSKYGTTFRYQNFSNGDQRGALEYNINSGKVVEIHGAIFAKWAETGFASGVLGLVTEDENTAAESPFKTVGKYSKFENGTIHWISNKVGENEGNGYRGQSFVTSGDLDAFYTSMGGTGGDFGFPIMDQRTVGGHGYCEFEGGKIEWDDFTRAYKIVSDESPLIVSTSFLPNPNGYHFENYGVPTLSWELFRNTFGENLVDNSDIAKKFYDQEYSKIGNGGCCFGMSASSLVLYKNNIESWGFNVTDDAYLEIFPLFIARISNWIEYYQGRQLCPAVTKESDGISGPNVVFNFIKSRMSGGNWINNPMFIGYYWWTEEYTDSNVNGFYDEGEPFIDKGDVRIGNGKIDIDLRNGKIDYAGHAVVPYKIEESQDHSSAKVFVYDSVHPGNHNLYFEFNISKNEVSPLKDETTNELIGGFHDNYLRINAHPICARSLSTVEQKPDRIPPLDDVANSAHLLYTDASGNHLGYLNGEFKSEILGAYRVLPLLEQNDLNGSSELYFVPELDLKREICGLNDDITTITSFKANTLVIAEVQVSSGSVDELYIPKDGSSAKFVSGKETSFLSLMLEREKTGVAQIVYTNISQIEASGAVNLSNNDGIIIIQNHGLSRNCSLHLEQAVVNPNSGDSSKNIVIEENSTILIKSVNWSDISNSNITIEHDAGSDGIVDYTEAVQLTDSTLSDSKSGGSGGGGSSSSKSSSSGGGGGGAGSAEDYANVEVKDVDTQYLRMNTNATYEFMREGNPIQSVSFYSLKNSGEITSTIEVLNNRSKLVNSTPEGSIYKYVNIWVGKSGFATPANIKNAKVKFKVNSSWLQDMKLNPADVTLQRHNGTAWEVLPTTLINSTSGYVIFESQTSGFSPFVITAEKVLASSTSDNIETNLTQAEDVGMNGTQPEKTPGFGFSMAILIVGVFAGGYVYLKRRQS